MGRNKIKHFKQIKLRKIPKNSYISADALIIFMQNKKQALNLRNELIKENIMTKILPEAIRWHFVGKWEHIKSSKLKKSDYKKSKKILDKAVSIPIFYKMEKNFPLRVKKALEKAISL